MLFKQTLSSSSLIRTILWFWHGYERGSSIKDWHMMSLFLPKLGTQWSIRNLLWTWTSMIVNVLNLIDKTSNWKIDLMTYLV